MNEILDGLRILLSLSFLTYASWSDWKTREISNRVWIFFAPLGAVLSAIQYVFFAPQFLFYYGLSVIVTFPLAIVLFYAGAFGGADAKALMCLALALPTYATFLLPNASFFWPILPLTVFSNAVLLAAFTAVYALLRNFVWRVRTGNNLFEGFEHESVWRKITVLITGYKMEIAALKKNSYVYPLEDVAVKETGEDERRLLTLPKDETRDAVVARIVSAGREGKVKDGVWVTPGLPLLIFITVGLIITLVFGDLVWLLLRFVFGAPLSL